MMTDRYVDLTHTFSHDMVSWNGSCGFSHDIKADYETVGFRIQQLKMHAGIGTHIDAPAHCVPQGKTIEVLSTKDLIVPCVVLDISEKASAFYSLTVQDVELWESRYGVLQERVFCMVYTGWDRFWKNPEQYRNNYQFPSVSKEAVQFLLARNIVGLGIDTLSPDRPSDGFAVHHAMLGAGKYLIENLKNLSLLPAIGGLMMAFPLKGYGLTEAPARVIVSIPP